MRFICYSMARTKSIEMEVGTDSVSCISISLANNNC